jgi:MFS family permease
MKSVVDGLRFLKRSPNLRMTFILDLCAMVFAQPRALFPALAFKVYGGGAGVVGLLQAAPAAGAVVAFLFSGWISRVRLQGLAIVLAVIAYGAVVGAVGLTDILWLGVLFLAMSGMADMVSSAFRNTVLQVAAPDQLRGRLQGVFIVVVAGGPRAGDFLAGSVASSVGERLALVLGGLACIVGVLVAISVQRRFLAYDARHPAP